MRFSVCGARLKNLYFNKFSKWFESSHVGTKYSREIGHEYNPEKQTFKEQWTDRKRGSGVNWEETGQNEKYLDSASGVRVHQSGVLSPLSQPQQGIDAEQTGQHGVFPAPPNPPPTPGRKRLRGDYRESGESFEIYLISL